MAGLVLVAQPFATALASDDERASTEIVFDADSARDPRLELVTPIAGSVEFTPDGMLLASQRNKQPSGVAVKVGSQADFLLLVDFDCHQLDVVKTNNPEGLLLCLIPEVPAASTLAVGYCAFRKLRSGLVTTCNYTESAKGQFEISPLDFSHGTWALARTGSQITLSIDASGTGKSYRELARFECPPVPFSEIRLICTNSQLVKPEAEFVIQRLRFFDHVRLALPAPRPPIQLWRPLAWIGILSSVGYAIWYCAKHDLFRRRIF